MAEPSALEKAVRALQARPHHDQVSAAASSFPLSQCAFAVRPGTDQPPCAQLWKQLAVRRQHRHDGRHRPETAPVLQAIHVSRNLIGRDMMDMRTCSPFATNRPRTGSEKTVLVSVLDSRGTRDNSTGASSPPH